jgi:glycosyltransferase involved in cell wall biosynthesis
VGTLEIRKNIWKVAQVWDRLRKMEGLSLPKLVFAGQPGWMIQDFERMLDATGYLSGWIEIIDKATDTELETLYKHSLFTITASYYEGWGLPIGESLAYGKTAVVAKTSSMPEVAGDLVEYCDPESIDSIMQACLKLIEHPEQRKHLEDRIAATSLRQWQDVADDLLKVLSLEFEAGRGALPY